MELDYKAIGKRIRTARLRNSLTQEKLSDSVGLSLSHMSNIETGATKVSLPTLVKIANALSVSIDHLMCDNIIQSKVQFENEIKLLIDGCDNYEIRVVKDIIATTVESLRKNDLIYRKSKNYFDEHK